jgi:hypothetical protein
MRQSRTPASPSVPQVKDGVLPSLTAFVKISTRRPPICSSPTAQDGAHGIANFVAPKWLIEARRGRVLPVGSANSLLTAGTGAMQGSPALGLLYGIERLSHSVAKFAMVIVMGMSRHKSLSAFHASPLSVPVTNHVEVSV